MVLVVVVRHGNYRRIGAITVLITRCALVLARIVVAEAHESSDRVVRETTTRQWFVPRGMKITYVLIESQPRRFRMPYGRRHARG